MHHKKYVNSSIIFNRSIDFIHQLHILSNKVIFIHRNKVAIAIYHRE